VLEMHCAHARYVYNLGLEQRSMWRRGMKSVGVYEQKRQLTEARAEKAQRDEAEAEVEKLRAERDAEFIAAAPDLVRDLLDEVKRLRSAGYDAFGWQRRCERAEADRDSAVAAVERAEALADRWENAAAAFGISDSELDAAAFDLRRALGGAS
jgi:hypothetical protein